MRPHEHKARLKTKGIAEAKVLLKDSLSWLRGYPAPCEEGGLTWMEVPPLEDGEEPRPRIVTGDLLRKATFGLKTLCERFPRILGLLVDDPPAWKRLVRSRLEVLGAAVHKGVALPPVEGLLAAGGIPRGEI